MTAKTSAIVLDASALIALIYQEKGFEVVEKYLLHGVISSVNLTEVATYIVKKQGIPIGEIRELLHDLALTVLDYDEEQAFVAAGLFQKTIAAGLSLGDRACLALGILKGLPVLTADRVWKNIDVGVNVECIR